MSGHGSKFDRKLDEAVAALMTQRNGEEAARSIGIRPATLVRWQKRPEFQKALLEARRAAFSQTTGRLQQASSAAATTLMKTMLDEKVSPSVRVRSAESIINLAAKGIEIEDIAARLKALEEAAKKTADENEDEGDRSD